MEIYNVTNDNEDRPNGHTEVRQFEISPDVEAVRLRGQEIRRVRHEVQQCLIEVVDRLLAEHPGEGAAIASMLEGQAQRIHSIQEQKVRRERESRRAKEQDSGTNGRSEGNVSPGVSAVSGDESGIGSGPEGSGSGNPG